MIRLIRMILVFCLVFTVFILGACKKKGEPAPSKSTRVSATKAYEKYFGPAPTNDKGACFAFVIYFPSAKEPGKVVPFPFFTFDEGSIKKIAVERLSSGMGVAAYRRDILQPFEPGTHLLGLTEAKGTVTVNFSKELARLRADAAGEKGVLNSIALTLAQFNGVREVRLTVEGEGRAVHLPNSGLIHQPLVVDETSVLGPSPPRLLDVVAELEKGAKTIEAVHVNFDRPVDIGEVVLSDKNGNPIPGEMFQSVFGMAAVLKPKDPSMFKAGMPVKVRWQVVDKLGRAARGEQEMPLEVKAP
jgi:germination protein M